MKIRKRRTKGTLKLTIAIVIMMSISIFGIIGMNADFHKSAQEKYNKKSESLKNNPKYVDVVKINDIYPTILTIDDSKFYIIDTGYYYMMLEADPKDDLFKKFITTKKEDLKYEEFYFLVDYVPRQELKRSRRSRRTVINVDSYLSSAFMSEFKLAVPKEKQNAKPFISNSYVSLTVERENNTFGLVFVIILSIVSLILSYIVYVKIKNNSLNYDKIEEDYPELAYDFKDINNNLSYIDNLLKIAIYKNGIIYYRNKFYYESFDNIVEIELFLKGREIIITTNDNNTYQIPLKINIKKENSKKNKEQKEQAQKLMKYIKANIPNVKVKG